MNSIKSTYSEQVRYNDQDYTDYEASQIQRAMERSIRESKRRAIAAKAAEDGATDEETKKLLKEKFSEESSILKQKEQRLKDFLKQTGRDAENSRVRVNGFDRSISQKAVWANRKSQSSNSSAGGSNAIHSRPRHERDDQISASIDARKYQYGRTPGVEYYGDKISKRQQEILSKIPNYGDMVTVSKSKASLNDLSALTAYTGHEFAMFTKGGKRCIMRGNETKIPFTEKDAAEWRRQGFKWSAHTHPGRLESVCLASEGDLAVLKAFGQKRSVIINSSGHRIVFEDTTTW